MVDDAVLQRERAHARLLAQVARDVGAGHRGERRRPDLVDVRLLEPRRVLRAVVVVGAAGALLLLGDGRVEVVVEVAAGRRRPREGPAHPAPVGEQLVDRGERDRHQRHVVVGEVHMRAIEAVGDRRASRAAGGVLGPEHEVVDEQLRVACKEVGQRGVAVLGLEAVVLLDLDPGQPLALLGDGVAAPDQVLLGLEQLEAGGEPLLAGCSGVGGHRVKNSFWINAMAPTAHIRGRLMGSIATNTAIRPMLEPRHQAPKRAPERSSA